MRYILIPILLFFASVDLSAQVTPNQETAAAQNQRHDASQVGRIRAPSLDGRLRRCSAVARWLCNAARLDGNGCHGCLLDLLWSKMALIKNKYW